MSDISIKVKRELFRFNSFEEWVSKGQGWYAKCGVPRGMYIGVDAGGHVVHMGRCFRQAAERNLYPVIVYELEPNWETGGAE